MPSGIVKRRHEMERAAFQAVQRGIKDLLGRGYQMAFFDDAPNTRFRLVFYKAVGEKVDSQYMVIPYMMVNAILNKNGSAQFMRLLSNVNKATHKVRRFIELMVKSTLESGDALIESDEKEAVAAATAKEGDPK